MPTLHATPLLLLTCAVLTTALPEALPEADPKAVPQLYGGPGGGQGYNPGTGGGYTGINTDPSGGQGYNPGSGGGYTDISTDPSGGQGYNPGTGGQGGGVWGLRPGGDQGPSPGGGGQCGMAEQCCGMADKGCCQEQGQKCYTVYERKCRHANKPVCQTMTKEFCDTYPVKQCRRIRKPEARDIPITDCRPQMERKCFEYDGKECEGGENSHAETYSWVNQELIKLPDKNITKCHDVSTCNIQVANRTLTRRVPKRKCEDVPNPRRTCRSVQVPQAPYEVPTMSYRTEYKRQCYKVSRPVCRQQQPQQPCPYQVVQKNICPTCQEPSYPGRGCGTPSCRTPRSPRSAQGAPDIITDPSGGWTLGVSSTGPSGGQGYNPGGQDVSNLPGNLGQGWAQAPQGIITDPNGGQGYNPGGCGAPVGGGGTCGQSQAMCGSCRQQPVQVCQAPGPTCENKEEEVCQQVPVRVPVPGTRTVQPPPKWEVKCEVQQEMVQRCRVEYEVEEYTVQKRGCTPGTEEKCFQYKVPDYELVFKNMNETLQFNTSKCTVVNVRKEHCADLPTRIDCQERTVKQSVMINQMVCDREKMARYCNTIPYSYCKNVPGQECSMEPRQVCQPACQQNNYCNQCTQFAASGGFSQCQTGSCPNYIGAPAEGGQIATNLPGNLGQGWAQGPQGITDGGMGYNPGNGK